MSLSKKVDIVSAMAQVEILQVELWEAYNRLQVLAGSGVFSTYDITIFNSLGYAMEQRVKLRRMTYEQPQED
jgi:hypothetical protein